MTYKHWDELAEILVNYSTRVVSGDRVQITMMEVETLPLARAVYAAVIKAGGYPNIEFQSAYLDRDLLRFGTMDQIRWVPEMQSYGMEWADVYVGLRGARNPHELKGISAEKIATHKRAIGKVSAMRTELTRWVLIRVPNEAFAQQASMSLDEMMEFFFNATLRDWDQESKRFHQIKNVFQAAENVRILGSETDISFSTKGRVYMVGEGRRNMPDGEVFTAPVEDSVNGKIYFEFPGIFAGQIIEGISLEFENGLITRASSQKNNEVLQSLLEIEGARRLGEFGVGANFGIDRFCYEILYDEKIGGTIHLALGRAYKETGGVNNSPLHWDMIKDLRQDGAVYLDGDKVLENGKFLF